MLGSKASGAAALSVTRNGVCVPGRAVGVVWTERAISAAGLMIPLFAARAKGVVEREVAGDVSWSSIPEA
jgi:hypothetical protein